VSLPTTLRRRSSLLACASLAAVCAGCVGPELPPGLGPAPSGPPAGPLAIAPLEVRYDPTRDRPVRHAGDEQQRAALYACEECESYPTLHEGRFAACAECGHTTYGIPFARPYQLDLDSGILSQRLRAHLDERGGFESVTLLEEGQTSPGLLLEVQLTRAAVEYRGHTWVHGLKIALFVVQAILIFPGVDPLDWFLPGEEYAIQLQANWTLKTARGSVHSEGRVKTETWDAFAPWGLGIWPSRGWFFVGLFRAPNCLDEDDWAEVGAQLLPRAEQDLLRELVHAVESGRLPPESP
jgi:hypothetical protein